MEGSGPVITGAQQELINKYADVLGEDGRAMIVVIEEEARKPNKMPADVFKLIESCLSSLGQKAKKQELSDEVIKQKEPERLLQVEAIREHAAMLHGHRLNGDKLGEESVRQAMVRLVDEFMVAVDKDKDNGLDPDTAQMWKDQVHEITTKAKLDLDETILRGFGKQLGNSKKEIMAVSKDLVVGQSAGVAMEATRLASEACNAIKVSRESIRAALRELGAASDIFEASGPTRAQLPPSARPVVGNIYPEWAMGARPAALAWFQRPPQAWPAEPRPVASGWPPVHTPVTTAWPPTESLPRPRMKGAGGELSALMRGMMNAQANDSGWPTFSGKYVKYPRFRKEWWAYRQTYHGHVRDELVCRSLKERSLASHVRMLINDIDDLREAWNTLDTCFDRPEKYISEPLDPVVRFRSYKAFDSGAIREFYSVLRAAMMGARKAGLLGRLINDQTLPGVLARMPPTNWRQWAKERPVWMREAIEEAFWNFVDQKWRDALNIAAAEPPAWGAGSGGRGAQPDSARKEPANGPKAGTAAVHVTGVDGKRHRQGDSGRTCVFKDVMGCTAAHPPWLCKVFGKLPAGEREKLITDNRLCPFCLLHDKDKPCGAKLRPVSVACAAASCKGRHIQKLHDFLKDVFREENRVHIVYGDDGWEESDEAWELGEEEMMIVGTVQQEGDCSWQDACDAWEEQDEEAAAGVHQVRVDQEAAKRAAVSQCKKAKTAGESEEPPELDGLLLEGEEQEYFLELLMRKASSERPGPSLSTKNKAASTKSKKNKSKERRARGKSPAGKVAGGKTGEGGTVSLAGSMERQRAPNLAHNPETKGRGLARSDQEGEKQATRPPATSGGECSGQKTPDYS